MKINNIEVITITYYDVSTDEEYPNVYRRHDKGCWEKEYGDHWADVDDSSELEKAFNEFYFQASMKKTY